MLKRLVSIAISGVVVAGSVAPAFAGGKPVACYEPYRTAPVYDTIIERVQVRPGYTDRQVVPAVYGTRQRTVMVSPERVEYRSIPARYGYESEKVLIEPARTITRRTAPVYETRYRTVQVSEGGYSWEWQVINGRKVLCKVKHKPKFSQVAERVMVSSGNVYHETIPARYGYQKRKVVISPESTQSYVVPAQYKTISEQVVIQPEQVRKVHVPASYETRQRTVMVSPGQSGWNKVRINNHCKG